jgi:hypothetical protein
LSFPAFRGVTRRLVYLNLIVYFAFLLARVFSSGAYAWMTEVLGFSPSMFLHGALWQPLTYSFVHPPANVFGTALELLSLWLIAGFLEQMHSQSWVAGLYFVSVIGTALAATAIYAGSGPLGYELPEYPLYGCFGAIFGFLIAIGVLYGDMEFLLLLSFPIKARYMAVIYSLIAIAMLFGSLRMYAFAQLGGALAGLIYIRLSPRRGVSFTLSERWFAVRNQYYRWKRRHAARKFEVYMRSQGRTVHFDGQGKKIDDDQDDKKRWN